MDGLDSTAGIVALAAAGAALVALLGLITLAVRVRRIRSDQRLVLGEHGERDLVAHSATVTERVEELAQRLERLAAAVGQRLDEVDHRADGAISHSSVVRYDAFNETSGRQSSSVALLDDRANGVVLSAILQREQARVYAKPVVAGHSELDLSPEEQEAIDRARAGVG